MQTGQTSRQCFFKNAAFPMCVDPRAKGQHEFLQAIGMEAPC
jgi:hypothetical protein